MRWKRVNMEVVRSFCALALVILLVGCGSKSSSSNQEQFKKSEKPSCQNLEIKGEYLVHWNDGEVTVVSANNESEFVEEYLEGHKNEIISSEPHYRIQLSASELVQQRDWGGGVNWGVESIQADMVWNKNLPQEDIIVAVIDSGVNVTHPQLQAAIFKNTAESFNGLDDDGNGYIDDVGGFNFVNGSPYLNDYTGHGTHVAGIIAAQHNEGRIMGVAPNVKILPLAFIDQRGGGDIQKAVNAIRYAAQMGAKVINASWGGSVCSQLLELEIESLKEKNILFVSAAGNSGNDLSIFPEYPAAFLLDNLISVGASTVDSKTAEFSNYGDLVHLVAPGANIASTYPPEFDVDGSLDGIATLNGTSMATPFVSGAAGLLWSIYPNASYLQIKEALLNGVEAGPYPVITRGQLNLRKSYDYLMAQ